MILFGSVPNPTSGHTGPDIAPPMQISRPGHLGVMEPSLNGQPNVPWASRTSSENLPTINNELFALNIDGSMRHRSCAGTSHLRSVSCLNLLTQRHPMLPSFVCPAIFETRVSGTATQRVLHKCKASNRHFPVCRHEAMRFRSNSHLQILVFHRDDIVPTVEGEGESASNP